VQQYHKKHNNEYEKESHLGRMWKKDKLDIDIKEE